MNLFFSQCTRWTFHESAARRSPSWPSATTSRIWASKSSMVSSIFSQPAGGRVCVRRRRKDLGRLEFFLFFEETTRDDDGDGDGERFDESFFLNVFLCRLFSRPFFVRERR